MQHRCEERGRSQVRVVLAVAGVGLAVALVAALALFEPWRLFTSSEVHEEAPTSAGLATPAPEGGTTGAPAPADGATSAPPQDRELARGEFETAEHATSGEAVVLALADGRRFVRLEGLATSDGPDLHVWLSDAPSGGAWGSYDDGRSIPLGELTATHGDQNYEIPADADLTGMVSVVIWCDRFDVAFGTAPVALG